MLAPKFKIYSTTNHSDRRAADRVRSGQRPKIKISTVLAPMFMANRRIRQWTREEPLFIVVNVENTRTYRHSHAFSRFVFTVERQLMNPLKLGEICVSQGFIYLPWRVLNGRIIRLKQWRRRFRSRIACICRGCNIIAATPSYFYYRYACHGTHLPMVLRILADSGLVVSNEKKIT